MVFEIYEESKMISLEEKINIAFDDVDIKQILKINKIYKPKFITYYLINRKFQQIIIKHTKESLLADKEFCDFIIDLSEKKFLHHKSLYDFNGQKIQIKSILEIIL